MEYKFASAKFQDLEVKTVRLVARASELGVFTATTITIPLINISKEAIITSDVLFCRNLTDSTIVSAAVVGSNLVLTDLAIAATDVFDLVIRLK